MAGLESRVSTANAALKPAMPWNRSPSMLFMLGARSSEAIFFGEFSTPQARLPLPILSEPIKRSMKVCAAPW
jgi:hypothetical protein